MIFIFTLLSFFHQPNIELINNTENTFEVKVYTDGNLTYFQMKPHSEVKFYVSDNILVHSKRITNVCDESSMIAANINAGYQKNNSMVINCLYVYSRKAPSSVYFLSILQPLNICKA